jgi:hypothetical protein
MMISGLFDKENKELQTIISQNQVIQNISHKLIHDKNSKDFFNKLIYNIENYESIERMDRVYFEKNFKEMFKTLYLFYKALTLNNKLKNLNSKEIKIPCRVFPDYIGQRFMILISNLPIMELFYEELKYKEIFNKYIGDSISCGETMEEMQNRRLFSKDSITYLKFADDKEFLNYELRDKYIDSIKEDYENDRKAVIQEGLNHLLEVYKTSNNIKDTKLLIGSTYWDEKKSLTSESAQKFKEAILALSSSMEKEKKVKLEKLSLVLKDEFEENINGSINNLNIIPQKRNITNIINHY